MPSPPVTAALVAFGVGIGTAAAGGAPAALPGWAEEDHAAALALWRRACDPAEPPCAAAASVAPGAARAFLERHFVAVAVASPAFVTGYFEPELAAARAPSTGFPVPLHALPADPAHRAATRAEIEAGALGTAAPVLFWLADPVDAFFLHVQGSGRLRLAGGEVVRVGFAGRNAHPYRAIGRLLVEREGIDPAALTADRLAAWLRADPARGAALMRENPSYIFFREVEGLAPGAGPVGASGRSLTALRSAALDPAHHAPGSLVWLETALPQDGDGDGIVPFRRLLVMEDTGAAIRGEARVDLFFGSGAAAGLAAGRMRAPGRLHLLRPRGGPEAP